MKGKLFVFGVLIVSMILSCSYASVSKPAFSDVSLSHWASEYIAYAQFKNIINGYGDGTFKPSNQVKTGEFIKMAATCIRDKDWNFGKPSPGEHWAMPYVRSLNYIALNPLAFDNERLERPITRGEAVEICAAIDRYIKVHEHTFFEVDTNETYIKQYIDEAKIERQSLRDAINYCTQFGIINGFEDGSFRITATLTRAQAAKLIYVILQH